MTFGTAVRARHGGVDRSAPKTFALIERLSVNRRRNDKQRVGFSEHLRNLECLQNKLGRIECCSVSPTAKLHSR